MESRYKGYELRSIFLGSWSKAQPLQWQYEVLRNKQVVYQTAAFKAETEAYADARVWIDHQTQ